MQWGHACHPRRARPREEDIQGTDLSGLDRKFQDSPSYVGKLDLKETEKETEAASVKEASGIYY